MTGARSGGGRANGTQRIARCVAALALLLGAACARGGAPPAPAHDAPAAAVPDDVVVLTFDDAVKSHYTTVAPLLKQYGFGATFFVTEFVAPPFADTTKYMTWAQIAELSRMGFEIGNHTWHHTHVDHMDAARFGAELDSIEARAARYGIPKPVSFAYPAYVTSPAALGVLTERGYRFARTGGGRAYDPATDDPLLIPSVSTSGDNREQVLRALEQAHGGKVVVLTVHGVPDEAHPWVTTPPALFEAYLRWLHDHHYRVIALRDLDRYARLAMPRGLRHGTAFEVPAATADALLGQYPAR